MKYVSIGETAALLGVAVSTLRRWEREARLAPAFRTVGGHRRYSLSSIQALANQEPEIRKTLCYARVSSHDQKADLERQGERLLLWCQEQGFVDAQLISDLGSGLNYRKKGLRQLLRLMASRQFDHLVLTHKDRLLRFGSELIFEWCKLLDIRVSLINDDALASMPEIQLATDVIELMTVFSARLYGSRSHKNRRTVQQALV